mgnify:CR=1 FL=1
MHEELTQLAAISTGDAAAFARWCSTAEAPLRRALRTFAAQVDTEAVVQETLLRVWQVAPRFTHDGQPHALLRFAVRTSRNVALSECRRRRVTPPEEAPEPTVAPITPDPLLRAHLARCREKLPGAPRSALQQRLDSGGADDDTALAARLNMSLNTFLQNFTRARRFLRECLEKAGVNLAEELP